MTARARRDGISDAIDISSLWHISPALGSAVTAATQVLVLAAQRTSQWLRKVHRTMSSAIVIPSSSPPRVFARSPTSIDSSPKSLPSPSQLFGDGSPSRKRFKSNGVTRDGFTAGFSSAKSLLKSRPGAENVPLRTPAKEKFKTATIIEKRSPRFVLQQLEDKRKDVITKTEGLPAPTSVSSSKQDKDHQKARSTCYPALPPCVQLDGSSDFQREQALPRRTDWTPTKDSEPGEQDDSGQTGAPMLEQRDLIRSFSFDGIEIQNRNTDVQGGPAKRKHVDVVGKATPVTAKTDKAVAEHTASNSSRSAPKKKSKSPVKKTMTITKLATSHYFGQTESDKESPITQYLTATQARTSEPTHGGRPSVRQPTRKIAAKKGKRRLPSPESALRALNEQEAVFGFPSQLARDDVSTQKLLPSDPMSPQRTQAISIESTTPQSVRHTSRSVRTRSLWGAANRDDDNALLYVDPLDQSETPAMRGAFAGKDVLLEQGQAASSKLASKATTSPVRSIKQTRKCLSHESPRPSIFDVDDLDSSLIKSNTVSHVPGQARLVHTASRPAQRNDKPTNDVPGASGGQDAGANPTAPSKPAYDDMSIEELQAMSNENGLKQYKRRTRIIQELEQHWDKIRNPLSSPPPTPETHGGFLTKVHDVSSRPQPKSKARKKKADTAKTKASPRKVAKATKQVRAEKQQDKTPKPKARRTKPKAKAIPDEVVVDIDDAVHTAASGPSRKTIKAARPPTPPSTLPCAEWEYQYGKGKAIEFMDPESIASPEHATSSDIQSVSAADGINTKIRSAIMFESEEASHADRDHVKDPTWYEKILMYDPIILEDLTLWLNTRGLRTVHEDDEVSAIQVRTWCEANGICCLWRGGWRGNKAKNAES